MPTIREQISQLYPPKPGFTEKDLAPLNGKVYIVSGASAGIGKELSKILYAKHAVVYMAARSHEKTQRAIEEIKDSAPSSEGELIYVHLDLADLSTIKSSATQILERGTKIHILFNNAATMMPKEQNTVQGHDRQLGVNAIGPFLFTKLLTPALVETAKTEPVGTVRVVWVSSSACESPTVPRGGISMDNLDYSIKSYDGFTKYAISKAGNYLQAVEMAKRYQADRVVSISLNPGNLNSELWRGVGPIAKSIIKSLLLHPPIKGAYTELFAGLSPQVTLEKSGHYVVPFGRFMEPREDLKVATKTLEEGGTGVAKLFWEWNEEQVKSFL